MKRSAAPRGNRNLLEPAALFKALADPHRLAILLALARAKGGMCVCDFSAVVPLNQSTVSHHLKLLRDAGLVGSQRQGTWAYYTLTQGVRERLRTALDSVLPPPQMCA
jgi:ArsR family transcriptional regulator, arsenate/arsenite/antimonite-responsive transcriptional repressor